MKFNNEKLKEMLCQSIKQAMMEERPMNEEEIIKVASESAYNAVQSFFIKGILNND